MIFTNHHCGYAAIAGASTVEINYLQNGFSAYNKRQEVFKAITDKVADNENGLAGKIHGMFKGNQSHCTLVLYLKKGSCFGNDIIIKSSL